MDDSTQARRKLRSRAPWSRILLATAIGGPALAIGGVLPEVVVVFVGVATLLAARVATQAREPLRIPWFALALAALALVTLAQWAPLPGIRAAFAPGLDDWVQRVATTSDITARPGLSVSPDDTGLEVARLTGLVLLMICAAQLSWRLTAASVAATAVAVAVVGLGHELFGFTKIYGVYAAQDIELGRLPSMLGTFVNPNHQSGLLLLGIFSSGALAIDQLHRSRTARDASQAEARRDRALAAAGVLLLLTPALLLSLSRGAIAALVLVGPLAGLVALRGGPKVRTVPKRTQPLIVRLLVVAALVMFLAVFGQHGAWRELSTLWSDPGAALQEKLGPASHGLDLLELSTWLGTGRGTFVDLYPLVDPAPSHVMFTHLESAPATLVIEWGPLFGGALLLAAGGWWVLAFVHRPRRGDLRPRRVLLLGLLALGLQNLGDFSLEFLGVAAPAAALVGALSPAGRRTWAPSRARTILVIAGAAALVLALFVRGGTWAHRRATNDAAARGDLDLAALIRSRPLDGTLHAIAARQALQANDPQLALAEAELATIFRPTSIDSWLQRTEAHARLDQPVQMQQAGTQALLRVHAPVDDALAEYLLSRFPQPQQLQSIAPADAWAWRYLVRALIDRAPAHADALALARAAAFPRDPEPLLLRSRIALADDRAALARHHARLARQLDPTVAAGHIAIAQATIELTGIADAIEVLEDARNDAPLLESELGDLEERLIRLLMYAGDPDSMQRAREVAAAMSKRRSVTKAVASRRRELLRELREQRDGRP